jgi:hypothetical protein
MCSEINYQSISIPDVNRARQEFNLLWHSIIALDHHFIIFPNLQGRPILSTEWGLRLVVQNRWKPHLLPNHRPWDLMTLNYYRKGRPSPLLHFNSVVDWMSFNLRFVLMIVYQYQLIIRASFCSLLVFLFNFKFQN